MTTKRALILTAAESFGINSDFDLSPEELASGLKRLDGIAAEWDGVGIRVGYNLGGGLDDEAGIPDTANECFSANLAVRWAASFGKMVSPDVKVAATRGFNALYVSRGVKPQAPMSSRLPLGAGNRRGVLSQQYFTDDGEVPGLNDGAEEY